MNNMEMFYAQLSLFQEIKKSAIRRKAIKAAKKAKLMLKNEQ
ncbi:hypothetical protein RJI07_01050 [Mycoplasmatota bacterium WC30]